METPWRQKDAPSQRQQSSFSIMTALDFVLAIVLGAVATALLFYLLSLLFSPLRGTIANALRSSGLNKSRRQIATADSHIAAKQYPEALAVLRRSFALGESYSEKSMADLRHHHQNILSRVVIVAEEADVLLPNLADVEHLLIERSELLALRDKAQQAFRNLLHKRRQAGKETPSWGKEDFGQKLEEISNELKVNRKVLERELERLFDSFQRPTPDGVTYH